MISGILETLKVFGLTALFAIPLGLVLAYGRMSKFAVIKWITQIYLLVMRGTPLLLQVTVVYFALSPQNWYKILFDTNGRLFAAIIAFTLNYAAYFCEIYRGGIESIPKGQYEAASVLGFTKAQTLFKIVLPQVVKRILPPMSNELMTLVKDTALTQAIGVAEMYQYSTGKLAYTGQLLPLYVAGICYLLINTVVWAGFYFGEKKLSYYK